jgi:hypothetical protein
VSRRGASIVLGAGAIGATWIVVRRLEDRWAATDDEERSVLPGDEFVDEPASQTTRAITIDAEPAAVWPWIVQIGADRGGFYSYDWLENLMGLGIHSADAVVAEWQHRAVGDLVFANRSGSGGWYVVAVEEDQTLVLQMADVRAGRPADRKSGWKWEFLWTFALRRTPDGTTRLLVRERAAFGSRLTARLMAPLGPVSLVMTQKMLRGIKSRAERGRPETGDG